MTTSEKIKTNIDACVDEPAEALTRLISLFDGAGVLADGYDPRYKLIARFVTGGAA